MKLLNFFKGKSTGFYCGLGAGIVGIANAIIYIVYSTSVGHFDTLIFVLLLLAGLSCGGMVFTKFSFMPVIPAALFSAAFGFYINDRLIMFEEMINEIYGMTESGAILGVVLLIFALTLVCFITVTVAAFTDGGKDAESVGKAESVKAQN